jgi:hypothetical protein
MAMTALFESLRQVDRVPRPRLDDCVVISAPPAVHQPQVAILWQKPINLDLGNGNANGLLLLVLYRICLSPNPLPNPVKTLLSRRLSFRRLFWLTGDLAVRAHNAAK